MSVNNDKDRPGREETDQPNNSRRRFLGKAAYAAPTLISLGLLSQGREAQAQFGPPPSLEPENNSEPIPPPG
jgi:hypothetical protein